MSFIYPLVERFVFKRPESKCRSKEFPLSKQLAGCKGIQIMLEGLCIRANSSHGTTKNGETHRYAFSSFMDFFWGLILRQEAMVKREKDMIKNGLFNLKILIKFVRLQDRLTEQESKYNNKQFLIPSDPIILALAAFKESLQKITVRSEHMLTPDELELFYRKYLSIFPGGANGNLLIEAIYEENHNDESFVNIKKTIAQEYNKAKQQEVDRVDKKTVVSALGQLTLSGPVKQVGVTAFAVVNFKNEVSKEVRKETDLLDQYAKDAQKFGEKAPAPFLLARKGSAWLGVVKKGDQVLGKRSLSFNMSEGTNWLADENDFHKGLPFITEVGIPFEDYNLNSRHGSLQLHGSFQEDDEDMKDLAKAIEDLEMSQRKSTHGLQQQSSDIIDHNDLDIVVTDR
jgi:hypothetical protein